MGNFVTTMAALDKAVKYFADEMAQWTPDEGYGDYFEEHNAAHVSISRIETDDKGFTRYRIMIEIANEVEGHDLMLEGLYSRWPTPGREVTPAHWSLVHINPHEVARLDEWLLEWAL